MTMLRAFPPRACCVSQLTAEPVRTSRLILESVRSAGSTAVCGSHKKCSHATLYPPNCWHLEMVADQLSFRAQPGNMASCLLRPSCALWFCIKSDLRTAFLSNRSCLIQEL